MISLKFSNYNIIIFLEINFNKLEYIIYGWGVEIFFLPNSAMKLIKFGNPRSQSQEHIVTIKFLFYRS